MESRIIRSSFLEYFAKNGHKVVPSSPLVPHNDPTLMFTNSGMVQFKNYFTGMETPQFTRATTAQKCVRAGGKHNDLENVGYTARHHTFFEMLGNFSFGDYFKDNAIEFAWTLLTKEIGLDKSKLYVTVYHEDDEAYNLWKKIGGLTDDRIIRINTNDNFWSMGDVGPCGPCSEIFFDHGDHIFGGLPGTKDQDGDRYVEIWNLVFMQYEDTADGKRIALPKPSIDTGMGFERMCAALQGKHNNFEIDLFQNLIDASMHISGVSDHIVSHRVIADHIRSSSFLMADGVMPSNEGRGYVLRRIMRRAMRHVHNLGYKDLMLHKLVDTLIAEMGDAYPELRRAQSVIKSTLELEENKFRDTLSRGLKILDEEIAHLSKGSEFSGQVAFKLYDTYGFPIDLTSDVLRAKNISVNMDEFDSAMAEQKARAKQAWSGSGEKATDEIWFKIHEDVGATEFLGYSLNEAQSQVKAIIKNGDVVNAASKGEGVIIILNQTPFYAESGGQIGDIGWIDESVVKDTKKYVGSIFGHNLTLAADMKVGDIVEAKIDVEYRNKVRANHSATHLLHKALRQILGDHVTQKGSLVAPDKLRFDFSHPKALSLEERKAIEILVNKMVIENASAITTLKTPEEAINAGAMALFGEKYGDEVRVVEMGESLELCGGTHVKSTGDIGAFKIVSEESIASGVRRIEAVTGVAALSYSHQLEGYINALTSQIKCAPEDLLKKFTDIAEERKNLDKQLANAKVAIATAQKPYYQSDNLYVLKLEEFAPSDVKNVIDVLRAKNANPVITVSATFGGKVSVCVSVAKEYTSKYKAGDIAKAFAEVVGGNGGGKPDFAQAGGVNIDKIDEAIEIVKKHVC